MHNQGNVWRWLRASVQTTTMLGLAMIAMVWSSIAFHLHADYRSTIANAFQHTSNLARAFEEHTARTIRGVDGNLIVLRTMYEKSQRSFDFIDWKKDASLISDSVLQYAIIDGPTGRLLASSLGPAKPIDLSDREHFRAHVDTAADELFLGKPVIGRNSGKPSIQLSRRISNPDGSLKAVIVASLDPTQLTKFYETIDLGRDGVITLNGLDGVVRASRGFKKEVTNFSPSSGVLSRLRTASTGTFVTPGAADGVVRLLSYRQVAGLPVFVAVSLGRDEVLAPYYSDAMLYVLVGTGLTIFVLIVIALSARHGVKLERAYDWLRKSETVAHAKRIELRTTLENIDQGIIMVDAEGMIQVINRRTIELLDVPESWLASGRKLKDLLALLWDRGEFENNDFDPRIRDMLRSDGLFTGVGSYERVRPNGTVLEVRTVALPDGGLVRTFTDITERKSAEAQIAQMATHDDLTGVANRSLFRTRLDQALGRAQRYGESFAVLVLDLDRFKGINDTRGHPAGDAVLKEVARRLSFCVRETDTVARLGGDEFAILQTPAKTEDEIAQLARRIIRAMSVPISITGAGVDMGVSIGIARAPRDGANYDQLLMAADRGLYQAKNDGGSGYCFSHAGLPVQACSDDTPIRAVS